jgi:hypothetical protein
MGIEDAFADMSKPPPGVSTDFVFLRRPGLLIAYLIKYRALMALPLLIAVQRRLDVLKKTRAPLSAKVWKDAGNPSKSLRVTMMAHLRRVPDLVVLREDRHFTFRYSVEKGPAWRGIEKAGSGERGSTAENELEEEEEEDLEDI